MRGYLTSALAFAIIAALTRVTLLTTKTRLQMIVLIAAALLFELFGRRRIGQRPHVAGFLINAAVIALTMTAVKIAIEGPLHRPAWVRNLTTGLMPVTRINDCCHTWARPVFALSARHSTV